MDSSDSLRDASPRRDDAPLRRTRVKFCGFVRPADVDDAVALGVDAVGLVFWTRSPRAVDIAQASVLRRRLPSFVRAVGLFVNERPDVIGRTVSEVGLDVVQLHGDETPASVADIVAATRRPCWKALRLTDQPPDEPDAAEAQGIVGPASDPARVRARFDVAEFCVLDTHSSGYGGSGRSFDWSRVAPGLGRCCVLSGGLSADNVAAAIAAVRPFAVDASSGIQGSGPRVKDAVRMAGFLAAVERADRAALAETPFGHADGHRPAADAAVQTARSR